MKTHHLDIMSQKDELLIFNYLELEYRTFYNYFITNLVFGFFSISGIHATTKYHCNNFEFWYSKKFVTKEPIHEVMPLWYTIVTYIANVATFVTIFCWNFIPVSLKLFQITTRCLNKKIREKESSEVYEFQEKPDQ